MPEGLQRLYDALPVDGSAMDYDVWKNTLKPADWRYIQDARRHGNFVFSLETEGEGANMTVTGHNVRRVNNAD